MHAYADLKTFRRALGLAFEDRVGDVDLLAALEAASAEIDAETGRTFQPYQATHLYSYQPGGWGVRYDRPLWIDDCLAVTALVVAGIAWTVGQYILLPTSAPIRRQPYTQIARVSPTVSPVLDPGAFSVLERAISITGRWGYWEQLQATGATLTANIDASALTAYVTTWADISPGMTIRIDDEQMYVGLPAASPSPTGSPYPVSVERGVNGTVAVSHLSAAAVRRYVYPRQVTLEVLTRAAFETGAVAAAANASEGVKSLAVDDIRVEYGGTSTSQSTSQQGGSALTGDRLQGLRRRALFA